MNVKKRLDKLATASTAASSDMHLALARLLGLVDATLCPPRATSSDYGASVDAIRAYHRGGIRFGSGEGTGRSHVSDHRLRQSMAAAGWVTIHNNGRVKLTAVGDRVGRVLVGVANEQWLYHMIYIWLQVKDGWADARPGGWLSEFDLFGRANDMRDLDVLAPMLHAKCVESMSSTIGHVFYRAVADWVLVDVPAVEYSEQAAEAFTDAYVAAMASRKASRYSGNEVFMSMSATR